MNIRCSFPHHSHELNVILLQNVLSVQGESSTDDVCRARDTIEHLRLY